MAQPASALILRFAQDDSAVARGERVGRALAHVARLLFLKSSVKVVRHKNREFSCGGLWKKTVGGGVENVPCVAGFPQGTKLESVLSAGCPFAYELA